MQKQQVEYKVNIIGETELSEWSDEVVELLVEMFIKMLANNSFVYSNEKVGGG